MTPEHQHLAALRRQLMRLVTTQRALVLLCGRANVPLAQAILEVRARTRVAQAAAIQSRARAVA